MSLSLAHFGHHRHTFFHLADIERKRHQDQESNNKGDYLEDKAGKIQIMKFFHGAGISKDFLGLQFLEKLGHFVERNEENNKVGKPGKTQNYGQIENHYFILGKLNKFFFLSKEGKKKIKIKPQHYK